MEVLRKYGVATTILFPLIDRGTQDFESTPVTFVAADTQVSKDEAVFANTGSTPAHEGNGMYSLALTATEMQAARLMITVVDAATKAWEDQAIVISTYGNASGQHPFDLDTAIQNVNVASMDAGTVTASAIATDAIGAAELATDAVNEIRDAILSDSTAFAGASIATILADTDDIQTRLPATLTTGTADSGSATTVVDAVRTEADTDYWKGGLIRFTSGTISGQTRLITAFTPGTDTITFAPAATQAVSTNTYEILPFGAVDVRLWNGTVPNNLVSGAVDADVSAIQANAINAAAIATDAITNAKIAADAIGSSEFAQAAADKIWSSATRDLTALGFALGTSDFAAAFLTAALIATDAIGAAELAIDAVNEIRDAILSDSTPFAGASIATILADTDDIQLRLPSALTTGTADSGSTTTMVDAARTEADTDYWKGSLIRFTSGTIADQTRLITAFAPGTDTVTFSPATTQAVGTNTYEILPFGAVDLRLWNGGAPNNLVGGAVDADVSALQAAVITAAAIATDAIGAAELATDAVNKIRDAILSDSTAFAGANIDAAITTRATPAQVNTEVSDVLKTDTIAEQAQGAPTATPTFEEALGYLYMALRNRLDIDTTATDHKEFFNNAGTVIWKKALTDDGTVYSEAEGITGP